MTTGRINQVMYFILSQATFRRLLVRQDNRKSSEKRNFHIEMWIWTRFPVSANNLFDQPADIPQWWNTLWSAARKLAKILCRIYAEAVWIRHSHHWSDALHILGTFRPSCRVIMQHVETKKTQNFTYYIFSLFTKLEVEEPTSPRYTIEQGVSGVMQRQSAHNRWNARSPGRYENTAVPFQRRMSGNMCMW